MDAKHAVFFDAVSLAHRALKNRFVVAPMTRNSATSEGVPTEQMREYYRAFASGGFAAIITEGVYTDAIASLCNPNQPGIVNDRQIKGWEKITRSVTPFGALLICQLMHAGALSQVLTKTLAPSSVNPLGRPGPTTGGLEDWSFPSAMTLNDIKQAITGYREAAQHAVEAGFDGVEVHGANGYLLDQFITDYTNLRTDAYGGSVQNRFRIVAEILGEIRAVVPSGFVVGLRLSESKVNDLSYRWKEGPQMARQLFAEVKKAAPDYLHLAAEGGNWKRECLYADGSSSSGIAKQMLTCPVIANGGLHNLDFARQLLAEKQGDLLAIGRYAIANPDFPNRIRQQAPITPFDPRMIKPELTLENTRSFMIERVNVG